MKKENRKAKVKGGRMEERGTYTRILSMTFTTTSQRLQWVKLRVLNPENPMVLEFSTEQQNSVRIL